MVKTKTTGVDVQIAEAKVVSLTKEQEASVQARIDAAVEQATAKAPSTRHARVREYCERLLTGKQYTVKALSDEINAAQTHLSASDTPIYVCRWIRVLHGVGALATASNPFNAKTDTFSLKGVQKDSKGDSK